MSSKDYKKIAFYPNRKIFSQKFTRWNAELDERKNIFDIMGTLSNLDDEPSEVLTKPATSVHVSDVVRMAFRVSNMWNWGSQVNVSIQSNRFRFWAHLTLFCTNVWKKETFLLFVEGWVCGASVELKISSGFGGKEPVSRSKRLMFSLNASELWSVFRSTVQLEKEKAVILGTFSAWLRLKARKIGG